MEEQLMEKTSEGPPVNFGKKCVIIGASGAIGRVLVKELCESQKWAKISLIVRRELPQWKEIQGKHKLDIIIRENLDCLENVDDWKQFQGYDTFFCLLGSRVNQGKETFIKVDFTYCLWGAKIAKQYSIPHFSLLTATGSNPTSSFLYVKTKGQIEIECEKLKFNRLSIMQPGFLRNRDNDKRCMESFLKYCCCCCLGVIEATDMGKAIKNEAELEKNLNQQQIQRYSNKDCINLSKNITNSNKK